MAIVMVTTELSNAVTRLSIPSTQFQQLSNDNAELVYHDLLRTFVKDDNKHWWWESFSQPSFSVQFPDGKGYELITKLVPSSTELVWFLADEEQLSVFPVYEGTPEAIQSILGECYAFEYYIVPKTKEWLLCENHHNNIIGIGEQVISNLKQYS